MIANVRGYMLYGDYSRPNPPAAVMAAVEKGEVDAALVWGPLAGWYASRSAVKLRLEPVTPWLDDARLPMTYDISIGVRKGDPALLREVEHALAAEAKPIARILDQYHVPKAGG
jgi:mxaJ protein